MTNRLYENTEEPSKNNNSQLLKQCFHQQGCRRIQTSIDKKEISVKTIIQVIEPCYVNIMKDQFGNYLFQKIVKLMDDTQYNKMVKYSLDVVLSS